ncbi:MAG: AbrB/MazE/SpoVT family DNA-binding domain-containing protein [Chlamydiia bacterium]|nr:AbrB/MazE/SpoVT family DNA-binding domain-containing protein [Chlamydiia bacterium]
MKPYFEKANQHVWQPNLHAPDSRHRTLYSTKLCTKGRIVIPLEVRTFFKLKTGIHLAFEILDNNTILLHKVPHIAFPFNLFVSKKEEHA